MSLWVPPPGTSVPPEIQRIHNEQPKDEVRRLQLMLPTVAYMLAMVAVLVWCKVEGCGTALSSLRHYSIPPSKYAQALIHAWAQWT